MARNKVTYEVTEVYLVEVDETSRQEDPKSGKSRDVPLNITSEQIKYGIERRRSQQAEIESTTVVNVADPTPDNPHAYKSFEYGITKSLSVSVKKV